MKMLQAIMVIHILLPFSADFADPAPMKVMDPIPGGKLKAKGWGLTSAMINALKGFKTTLPQSLLSNRLFPEDALGPDGVTKGAAGMAVTKRQLLNFLQHPPAAEAGTTERIQAYKFPSVVVVVPDVRPEAESESTSMIEGSKAVISQGSPLGEGVNDVLSEMVG